MRIVDLPTFLTLPVGTVFAKYSRHHFDALSIKDESFGEHGDFWYVDLATPHFEGEGGSEGWDDILTAMASGVDSPPPALDLTTVSRDGLYDKDQLFAVYEMADVEALIARLQRTLEAG